MWLIPLWPSVLAPITWYTILTCTIIYSLASSNLALASSEIPRFGWRVPTSECSSDWLTDSELSTIIFWPISIQNLELLTPKLLLTPPKYTPMFTQSSPSQKMMLNLVALELILDGENALLPSSRNHTFFKTIIACHVSCNGISDQFVSKIKRVIYRLLFAQKKSIIRM